jgi:hypothetical protein
MEAPGRLAPVLSTTSRFDKLKALSLSKGASPGRLAPFLAHHQHLTWEARSFLLAKPEAGL